MKIIAPEIVASAKPGQFVNVYLERRDLLLPRPLSIADADTETGTLTLTYAVIGAGTEELSTLLNCEEQNTIEVMGALGNGFFEMDSAEDCVKTTDAECAKMKGADRILLIGGGLGVAPLLFAARWINERSGSHSIIPEAFLGFANNPWYTGKFEEQGIPAYTISDTVSVSGRVGNVIDLLNSKYAEIDGVNAVAYACGPMPMMSALSSWCAVRNIRLRVSLEARMGCGYGACLGCAVDVNTEDGQGHKNVCSDGPVFDAESIVW